MSSNSAQVFWYSVLKTRIMISAMRGYRDARALRESMLRFARIPGWACCASLRPEQCIGSKLLRPRLSCSVFVRRPRPGRTCRIACYALAASLARSISLPAASLAAARP